MGSILKIAQGGEHVLAVTEGPNTNPTGLEQSLWIDQEGVAQRRTRQPGAVVTADRSIRVRQERVGQTLSATERPMAIDGIRADPHNLRLFLVKRSEITLETPGFQGATRGEIPGIEVQHQPTTPEVGQREGDILRVTCCGG